LILVEYMYICYYMIKDKVMFVPNLKKAFC